MLLHPMLQYGNAVALRKESVDRNNLTRYDAAIKEVALRKESVDRNFPANFPPQNSSSRSPQGERG